MKSKSKQSLPGAAMELVEKTELLRAVDTYQQNGWKPLPIPFGSKGPVLENWQEFRLNPAETQAHFGGKSNVGLLLGEPSGGLIDIDFDHPAALGFSKLLPSTDRIHGRARNPSSHYWYQVSGSIPKTKRFRDPVTRETLIEFRSTGGQTVVPPSVYTVDGVEDRLTWVRNGKPAIVDGNALLKDVAGIAARALIVKHYPREAGSRHDIALAIAGFLLRGGMSQSDAEKLIEAVCAATDDEEVNDRVKAVADTAKRLKAGLPATGQHRLADYFDPRVIDSAAQWLGLSSGVQEAGWDVPIPFDELRTPEIAADVLPGEYAAFAKALAEAAEVPESMTVIATLGAISAAVTKKFVASPKERWFEALNIYTMVALPPANNKSLVLREAVHPIENWEFDRNQAMQDEVRRAASTRRNEESTIASMRTKAARAKDPGLRQALFSEVTDLETKLTQVPVPPKVYVNDVTPESLATAISEQNGKIAIISDEGGVTETIAGLYSGGKANFDIVLKGYDGGQVRLKRKDREFDMRPYISITLFVQPQVLRNMAGQKAFMGRGLFERFLYLIPNSKLGHRKLDTRPVPDGVAQAYQRAIKRLLDLEIPMDGHGNEQARILRLSPDAEECWAEFRSEIEPQLASDGRLNSFAGWGGKIAGTCVRIAGLLHAAEFGESSLLIQHSTMSRAIKICRALIEHALAAFSMMQTDQAVQDAEAIYKWIVERGEARFGRTECLRKFHGRLNQKRYDAALVALRHHNLIGPEAREVDPTSGRGRRYYEVNPLIFDRKP